MFISKREKEELVRFMRHAQFCRDLDKATHLELKEKVQDLNDKLSLILTFIGAELTYEPGGWKVTPKV